VRAPGTLRFLEGPTLAGAAHFPPDVLRPEAKPSTLDRPRILHYQHRGWSGY
jgi:predicted membrane-bound spermidine synthase